MRMIKIDSGGHFERVDATFDDLRKHFGGSPVEHVKPKRLIDPYCMLCDEEFLIKEDKPKPNIIGCFLYQTDIHGYPICGDIYIAKDALPEIVGLDDRDIEIVEKILNTFRKGLGIC